MTENEQYKPSPSSEAIPTPPAGNAPQADALPSEVRSDEVPVEESRANGSDGERSAESPASGEAEVATDPAEDGAPTIVAAEDEKTAVESDEGKAVQPPSGAENSLNPSDQWGYVDDDGMIHLREGKHFAERVIGTIKGRSAQVAFEFLVDRFKKITAAVDELEEAARKAGDIGRFSERFGRMFQRILKTDGLGDFDALLGRLVKLQEEASASQEKARLAKEALIAKAEEIRDSTSWTKTTEQLKALQQEWRGLGTAGRDSDDALWKRFRAAMDHFFEKRDAERKVLRGVREEAKKAKEELCVKAEALVDSTEWEKTAKEHEELMASWKQTPWCGRADEDRLWARFKAARQTFAERRRQDRKRLQDEREENKKRKEELCEAVEALAQLEDVSAACEQAKLFQVEWKKIGPVPRAVSEKQWQRFREGCNVLFDKLRTSRPVQRPSGRQDRGGQGAAAPRPGFVRQREHIERLRESVVRDADHIDRWSKAVAGFKGEGGAMKKHLEDQIASVEIRLAENRKELERLEKEARSQA